MPAELVKSIYGNVEVPMKQDGGGLSRKDARENAIANRGMNRRQFRQAYRNAKAGLRNNTELSRAEVRDAARRAFNPYIMGDEYMEGGTPLSAVMPAYLPEASINVNPQVPTGPMVQLSDPSQMNDQLSFNRAFGRARKMGLDQFRWRGNDYTTELARQQPSGLNQARQIHADTYNQNQRIMEETGNRGGVGNAIKAGILSTLNYPMK